MQISTGGQQPSEWPGSILEQSEGTSLAESRLDSAEASTETLPTSGFHERNESRSTGSEVATSLSSSLSPEVASSQQVSLMSSTFPTTVRPLAVNMSSWTAPSTSSNGETRLRWVDFRRHQQAFPPRMPQVPGIPSGFRNPMAATITPPLPTSPMYNPGAHHSFFGGSSSNPVGFGGSVNMEEETFKTPNPTRRFNITRVERK